MARPAVDSTHLACYTGAEVMLNYLGYDASVPGGSAIIGGVAKEGTAPVVRPHSRQLFCLLLGNGVPDFNHARFFLIFPYMRCIISQGDESALATARRCLHKEILWINLNQRPCLAALLGQA